MIIKKIKKNFQDNRGIITDIIVKERIDYVTLITNLKNAVRGNHFHKQTIQFLYVLKGSILVASKFEGKRMQKESLAEIEVLQENVIALTKDRDLLRQNYKVANIGN